MKQMINSGASRTIPESAKATSTILLGVIPTGADESTGANCTALRVSAKPFISVLQKNNFLNSHPLFSFFYRTSFTLLYQINGRCTI
jgi:hypothetical protein